MNKSQLSMIVLGVSLMGYGHVVTAEESISALDREASASVSSPLKTVFLSKETRDKIDRQREAYLNPITEKESIKLVPKGITKKRPAKKRVYIPPKVSVSLVMVKPDGSRLVKVNNRYNRSPSRHIQVDFSNSTPEGVPVIVQGKTQVVPVGSTLLTRKNKLVETYKLEKAKRKASAPKTEQKAVKQRLEQIKILKPE